MASQGFYMIPLWRLVVLAAAGPLAWLALTSALANVLSSGDFEELAWLGNDPVNRIVAFSRLDSKGKPRTISLADRRAAQAALIREPLLPEAIWLLQTQDIAKPIDDLRILQLGERISRRDLATELSLAHRMASTGEVNAALVHLDRSLITGDLNSSAMIKQLAAALDDPAARVALARYSARPWMEQVLRSAFSNGPEPLAVASFVADAGITPQQAERANLPALLHRLADVGLIGEAQTIARTFGWKGDIGERGFAFDRASTDRRFLPLSWMAIRSDAVDGQFGENWKLRVEVQGGKGGEVLSRITALEKGSHTLVFSAVAQSGGQAPAFQWTLQCGLGANGRKIWEQWVPLSEQSKRYRTRFDIPSGCPIQFWSVRASAFDSQLSSVIELSELLAAKTI